MNDQERKCALRREVRMLRKGLSESEIEKMSGVITEKIVRLDQFARARTVFLYMDLAGEVQMRGLIRQCLKDGKRMAIPRVEGRTMRFYRLADLFHLVTGKMGILEPDPEFCPCMDEEEDALMIIPGVAFDRALNRIGYGAGYYDRYLVVHKAHPTVAVAFECQLFDEVPCDRHDIRPQCLITERASYLQNV